MCMNQVVTIPQKIAKKGDLILIPKEEYDALVRGQKTFIRDADIDTALEEIRQRKAVGPFDTVNGLMKSLLAGTASKRR